MGFRVDVDLLLRGRVESGAFGAVGGVIWFFGDLKFGVWGLGFRIVGEG